MNTLLLVEDEEDVRNTMAAMIRGSDVPVEQIVEFDNGQDALSYLKSYPVDVVFTDIHMPKMDGCELTGAIADLELDERWLRPKVVVVSGSADFQCVVELLKYGARDYIIKPAAQSRINEVLLRMEIETAREKTRQKELDIIYRQHLRNLLKHPDQEDPEACDILCYLFGHKLGGGAGYRLVLANPSGVDYPLRAEYKLTGVNGDLYFVGENEIPAWKKAKNEKFCLGISREHTSLGEIRSAYEEALTARKLAFIYGKDSVEYEPYEEQPSKDLDGEIDKFLQQIPTDKMEAARKRFQNLFFEARHHRLPPLQLVEVAQELTKRLGEHYANIYSRRTGGMDCPRPLDLLNADAFLEDFDLWLYGCQEALTMHSISIQKTDKICQALEYIQENYQKDLNLAIVSNHVSMNYSMFSNAFKQYTGVNFVNYLKAIRISEAKRLLEETNEKIAEVGAHVGYENDKHFMKTFKAICGVSPSEYRRNMEMIRSGDNQQMEAQGK
jgi:AraC-like DNA-binding protein/CheY-like chemotaxis protein